MAKSDQPTRSTGTDAALVRTPFALSRALEHIYRLTDDQQMRAAVEAAVRPDLTVWDEADVGVVRAALQLAIDQDACDVEHARRLLRRIS